MRHSLTDYFNAARVAHIRIPLAGVVDSGHLSFCKSTQIRNFSPEICRDSAACCRGRKARRCFPAVDRNRSADQVDRPGVAFLRMGDETKQMQAVGMPWIDRQTLPVEPLGFLYAPRLVILQGGSKHPWNGWHLARRLAR